MAGERELGDRSAGMRLPRLSCLLTQPMPPCWRAPVSSTCRRPVARAGIGSLLELADRKPIGLQ